MADNYPKLTLQPTEPLLYKLFNMDDKKHFAHGFNALQNGSKNYKTLARHYHPDRKSGCMESSRKTKIITSSWRILICEENEAVYRIFGRDGLDNIGISHDWSETEALLKEVSEFWATKAEPNTTIPDTILPETEIKTEPKIKKEPGNDPETKIKQEPGIKTEPNIKQEPGIKKERNPESPESTNKKFKSDYNSLDLIEIISHACKHGKHVAKCRWSNGNESNIPLEDLMRYPEQLSKYLTMLAANRPRIYGYLHRNHQYLFNL